MATNERKAVIPLKARPLLVGLLAVLLLLPCPWPPRPR